MNLHPIQRYLKCFKSYFLLFFVISLLILPSSLEGFAQATSEGKASWIGERFQGKKTSSGELFDMNDLTASHATLPYGSKVKVTSKKTGKSVVVRVNNRSEIDNGRLIDLSKRAAEQIGLIEEGVGLVKVETVSSASAPKVAENKNSSLNIKTSASPSASPVVSSTPVASKYVIQYASFFDLDNAVEFRDALKKKGLDSNIEAGKSNDGRTVYRVNSIGQYNSKVEAKNALNAISPQEGFIMPVTSEAPSKATVSQPTPSNTAKPTTTPPVNKASTVTSKTYEFGIQFGAFGTQANAKDMQNKLLVEKGIKTIIHQFPDDDKKLHRVLTNRAFTSRAEAENFLQQNTTQGVILTFVK